MFHPSTERLAVDVVWGTDRNTCYSKWREERGRTGFLGKAKKALRSSDNGY